MKEDKRWPDSTAPNIQQLAIHYGWLSSLSAGYYMQSFDEKQTSPLECQTILFFTFEYKYMSVTFFFLFVLAVMVFI